VNSVFEGTDEILEAVREAMPNMGHVHPVPCSSGTKHQGRYVGWISEEYVVRIDTDRVLFMQGNLWNFEHAAGVMEAMRGGYCFEIPAARVYRITASDVRDTQSMAKRGELSHQWGMIHPWARDDIGEYRAQLLDGNHRAAAAMALGEPYIWVYVGENYRENVRKKDWIRSNPAANENGRFLFVTSCIDSTYEDIQALIASEQVVSRDTFRKAIGPEQWHDLVASLGYDRYFPITRDWHVGYYKGVYRGVPAYFLRHSRIEYIHTLDGAVGDSLAPTPSIRR
jgi:hypothetical protein